MKTKKENKNSQSEGQAGNTKIKLKKSEKLKTERKHHHFPSGLAVAAGYQDCPVIGREAFSVCQSQSFSLFFVIVVMVTPSLTGRRPRRRRERSHWLVLPFFFYLKKKKKRSFSHEALTRSTRHLPQCFAVCRRDASFRATWEFGNLCQKKKKL